MIGSSLLFINAFTFEPINLNLQFLELQLRQSCEIRWAPINSAAESETNITTENYYLPEAFSLHGSFYSWLPKGDMPNTVIALSNTDSDFFQHYFESVTLVEKVYNPYADEKENLVQNIFICKSSKQDFEQLKLSFKERIFE